MDKNQADEVRRIIAAKLDDAKFLKKRAIAEYMAALDAISPLSAAAHVQQGHRIFRDATLLRMEAEQLAHELPALNEAVHAAQHSPMAMLDDQQIYEMMMSVSISSVV